MDGLGPKESVQVTTKSTERSAGRDRDASTWQEVSGANIRTRRVASRELEEKEEKETLERKILSCCFCK